ncbi:MAG: universal stress protein [Desulfobacterales bacterium]|nr:universal stress protein [Desulfobacterales bacterium]
MDNQKLLLSLDIYDAKFKIPYYISKVEPFKNKEIILFSIFESFPYRFLDVEFREKYSTQTQELIAWKMNQLKYQKNYMDKAKQILLDAGFSKDLIFTKIQEKEVGFARDILREAKKNYSAVAIGRKDMGNVATLILGSVATKLIEKLVFVPIMIVGENADPNKILIAMDGSEGSSRAVDFVARTLGHKDIKIGLIHVIRGETAFKDEFYKFFSPEKYEEDVKDRILPFFEDAKNFLIKMGVNSENITTKIVSDAASRAESIVIEAKEQGYGTIVLGRRGLSKVQEFFMGRVSNKAIQLVTEQALWIVS